MVNEEDVTQRMDEALDDGHDILIRLDIFQQGDEFITAHAGHNVATAYGSIQPLGYSLQYLIANMVTQCIIDELEAIAVDNGHCPRGAYALGTTASDMKIQMEQAPVGEADKRQG